MDSYEFDYSKLKGRIKEVYAEKIVLIDKLIEYENQ